MNTPELQPSHIEHYTEKSEQASTSPIADSPKLINPSLFENSNKQFTSLHDRDIWQAFKEGDESAFIFIYTTYFKSLLNYGLQFSNESDLIEDSIQDLFVELRKKRKRLGDLRTTVKLYLFICLKRRILEYKKRSIKKMSASMEAFREFEIIAPTETHLINETVLREQKTMLSKALNNLTKKQREVVYYFYYQNMTYKEVKDIMGFKNIKSVRNMLYKSLAAIKVIMKIMIWLTVWMMLQPHIIVNGFLFS